MAQQPPATALKPPLLAKVPRVPFGEPDSYIQFVNRAGKIVLRPGDHVRLPLGDARAVAAGRRGAYFTDAVVARTHVRIYTVRTPGGAVELARSLRDVDSALGWIRDVFIGVLFLALAATTALAYLVARATLRPVAQLTADAERIAATRDLRAGTDERRSDELGRLAKAFNTMLRALADSLSAQRQLVADASHELRTPLTTARTSLESLERHPELELDQRQLYLGAAISELEEMTALIDELVDLARGDIRPPDKQPMRLDELTDEAISAAKRRTGRDIRAELEPTVVSGSADDVARAIANLLDNAIKWSPPSTPVDVTLLHGALSVRDHGPGVPPEEREHIFDRFYRAAGARTLPGSGLGLAIVRQVTEAHGGSVDVETAPGGGAVFTLRLPIVVSSQNGRHPSRGTSCSL